MSGPPSPVVIRLPNWVGDVVMSLPALARLEAAGHPLKLVGRRWAGPLLAGCFAAPAVLPAGTGARIRLLRDLGRSAPAVAPPRGQADTLLLTNSFSSALEARLAGLHPLGYRQDGRGWLLTRAIDPPAGVHESERFDRLAQAVLAARGRPAEPAETDWPRLSPSAAAVAEADALLARRIGQVGQTGELGQTGEPGQTGELGQSGQIGTAGQLRRDGAPRFACLVPVATGTLKGASKAWPAFPAFAAGLAERMPVVARNFARTALFFRSRASGSKPEIGVSGVCRAASNIAIARSASGGRRLGSFLRSSMIASTNAPCALCPWISGTGGCSVTCAMRYAVGVGTRKTGQPVRHS